MKIKQIQIFAPRMVRTAKGSTFKSMDVLLWGIDGESVYAFVNESDISRIVKALGVSQPGTYICSGEASLSHRFSIYVKDGEQRYINRIRLTDLTINDVERKEETV